MSSEKKIDPRIKRSRLLLRDALVSLIEEKDYDKVTVQEIAERAGLNRATFYLHFKDKQDLLDQSTDEILTELMGDVKITPEVILTTTPPPHIVHFFEQIAVHARFFQVMLVKKGDLNFSNRLLEEFHTKFRHGMQSLVASDDQLMVPKDLAVQYITSALIGVLTWWLKHDMPYTPRYLVTNLFHLARHGPMRSLGILPIEKDTPRLVVAPSSRQ
ncbi:TetR family transcriptional regulator [Tumebacillus sp. BK434]|uniref:TetR/AcrR family transcriptional regulator n=1 Tax=Tumebacillus sp. BK434 TaxID=2512169 RepID=UPI0010D0D19E|nr:TetR/AcrR family transcriptional regulator [Tumebacillus sp. BK434]TCP52521.1 TetR family transcriptional regulator [Tumebacillus sp. BK434]